MTSQATVERKQAARRTPLGNGIGTESGPSARLGALDGLRGVAALVVVLHHLLLMAGPELRRLNGSGVGSVFWWLSQTPLKLLTAGSEAVLLFFVLSGLVVALPGLKSGRFSWIGFLSGRVVRLYVPVWASIAIATAFVWFLPRNSSAVTPGSWMATSQATTTGWDRFFSQVSLTRVSYDVNNVLWSLRWELVFSVLLPLFVALAIIVGRYWAVALASAWLLSTVGILTNVDALRYLPVFFIGTLFAVRLEEIREWSRRRLLGPHPRRNGAALVIGSLGLLIGHWLLLGVVPAGSLGNTLLRQLSVLGSAGVLLAAVGVPVVRRALESRIVQWFGLISFSLYLVHVPIIATLTFIFGDQLWWLVASIAFPVAIVVAWGFHRIVERPSQRLARFVSREVAARVESHRGGLARSTD
ncbi:MAG: acyltransferase [Actinomycetota bacterium]